jgi:aminoacyl tRNA synthase complex-interacting multifunctional protein 1
MKSVMTSARFVLAGASPLRGAWSHILSILRVPSENISVGEHAVVAQVVAAESNQASSGTLPILSVLRASAQDEELRAFLGANDAASRALVNQWATLASRIALLPSAADEAELQLGETAGATQEYLTSSPRATVADVLLYASLTAELEERLPRLSRWAAFVAADSYIAPIARARAAAAAASVNEEAAGEVKKPAAAPTGLVKPSAEEIERRRVEKEKAKAEKERQKQAEGGSAAAAPAAVAAAGSNPNQKASNASKVDSVDIDIRVGRIESINRHPEADKLFVETISLGPNEAARTIVSGLVEHYSAEELLGAYVLVVCNLKAKPLKGVTSHGMVLCASNDSGAVKIVSPPEGTAAGERVQFGGKLSSAPPAIPSNAATIELLSHFRTTADGIVTWKDQLATVAKGPVTSSLLNALVK